MGSMEKVSTLQVPSDLKALDDVLNWFEVFKADIASQRDWMECQLALTEAFTNVVLHAHKHLPSTTPVEIQLRLSGAVLELSVWDQGIPFDLMGYLAALPQRVNTENEGGRGLFLIKAIASEIGYIQDAQGRNGLVIRKHLVR